MIQMLYINSQLLSINVLPFFPLFSQRIIHPGSGRTLEVYSNHPGLQFSTGNDLPDPDCNYPPDFEDYCDCTDNVR